MEARYLIPEWGNPKQIGLIWPEELYKNESNAARILEYYIFFIRLLISNEIPVLILTCMKDETEIRKDFNNDELVDVKYFQEVSDLWIRDFGPVFQRDEKGVPCPVKFLYEPSYHYTAEDKKWGDRNEKAGQQIVTEFLRKELKYVTVNGKEIKLDGGNLVHNGNGKAIITSRILSENELLKEEKNLKDFKKSLGISELIIIPPEPGDDTGHVDGMVRFLDEQRVLVNWYPYDYIQSDKYISYSEYLASRDYTGWLAHYLKIEKGLTVLRMPSGIPRKNIYDFENATGNYMNFLRVQDKIFLPYYGDNEECNLAKQVLLNYKAKHNLNLQVVQVKKNATPLAEYGGVLNCITLHLY